MLPSTTCQIGSRPTRCRPSRNGRTCHTIGCLRNKVPGNTSPSHEEVVEICRSAGSQRNLERPKAEVLRIASGRDKIRRKRCRMNVNRERASRYGIGESPTHRHIRSRDHITAMNAPSASMAYLIGSRHDPQSPPVFATLIRQGRNTW